MKVNTTMTVGVDIGDKKSDLCVLDQQGKIVQRLKIQTKPQAFGKFFGKQPNLTVVIEVSTHSPWIAELLHSMNHTVIVANASRVAMISKSQKKNDRLDAEILAKYGRIDPSLLSPIQHRSKTCRKDLTVLRKRAHFVTHRTATINFVRGLVKSEGYRVRTCSSEAFANNAREDLSEELVFELEPLLSLLEHLQKQIEAIDQSIEELGTKYPETKALQSIHGVGPISATAFVLTIEDPKRFRRSRQVPAYLGLVPKSRQSGESNPQLGITKSGDKYLRSLLVQCAQHILGPLGKDSDLRRWGLKLAGQGKNTKRRAIIAVARRLAVLMFRLWKTGERYVPLYSEKTLVAA